jgi:predicted permease
MGEKRMFFQDIRYSIRALIKTSVFTIVVVLTLAVGIGANTAIFTLVNTILLKPLPVSDPASLVVLGDPGRVGDRAMGMPQTDFFSYPFYKEIRDGNNVFSGVYAAGSEYSATIQKVNDNTTLDSNSLVRIVTGNYFKLLGVSAAMGRTISPEDDTVQHGNPVAVISYRFWQTKLQSAPNAVGSVLRINNYPFTVVGVAQPDFFGDVVGDHTDFFVPLTMQSEIMRGQQDWYQNRNASWLQIVGRLKPGVSLGRARTAVGVLYKQILAGNFGAALDPEDLKVLETKQIAVVDGSRGMSYIRADYHQPLLLLMALVGLVLLIACVNIANLLLTRSLTRDTEIAVRLALGAPARRIIQQLLMESILLALLGGMAGFAFASWGVSILTKFIGADLITRPDIHILGFTFLVSVLSGIFFGLLPAIRCSRISLTPALRQSKISAGASHTRWGWGKILVAGQVALLLFVLFSAGLLVRSLHNLQTIDLGYNQKSLLLVRLEFLNTSYEIPQITNLAHTVLDQLAAAPGVRGVTVSSNGLFSGNDSQAAVIVPGFDTTVAGKKKVHGDDVGPKYFSTLGIPVQMGREIQAKDTAAAPKVAVLNEAMAKLYFPGQNPIGRKFMLDSPGLRDQPIEVIGVVRDNRQQSLIKPIEPTYYLPFFQVTNRKPKINLEIQTASDPALLISQVRKQIRNIDSNLVIHVNPMEQMIGSSISEQVVLAKLAGAFAVVALVLACIGLYGIMSYTVANRTREIGLRIALGAQRMNILWLIVSESLLVVGVGVLVGIPASLFASRILSAVLFGVTATDPSSLIVVILILAVVALLASYLPARRAARLDPLIALRLE